MLIDNENFLFLLIFSNKNNIEKKIKKIEIGKNFSITILK